MSDLDWTDEIMTTGWFYAVAVVVGTLSEMALVRALNLPPSAASLVGGAVAGALLAARMGKRTRPWAAWVGASAVGWTVSARLAEALYPGNRGEFYNFLSGFAFGTAQWLVVRRRSENAVIWVALGAVVWSILWPLTWMAGDAFIKH